MNEEEEWPGPGLVGGVANQLTLHGVFDNPRLVP